MEILKEPNVDKKDVLLKRLCLIHIKQNSKRTLTIYEIGNFWRLLLTTFGSLNRLNLIGGFC